MPFVIPSFDELRQFFIAAFAGRFPDKNVSRSSDLYKRLSVNALGTLDNHFHLRQVGLDVMADTAEREQLDRHMAIYGVDRKGAVGSARSGALRVFGTVAAVVPVSEPMTHTPSGLLFETRSGGVIGASGFLDVDVGALSTGIITNLEEGEELTFDAPPAGLEANSRILADLLNGIDRESDPDGRDRLLNRIGEPAAGGNRNDFEQFVLESADFVDTAYVYPNRNGAGSVDLAALKAGSGTSRLLDVGERTEVFDFVDPIRPVTATIRVLEVTTSDTDVEVVVLPESDVVFSFDWNDTTPPVVSSYTSATRLVALVSPRPIDLAIGDRVVFADPLLAGVQFIVESLSGANDFVITDDAGAIAAGNVYSGGPLTDAIRDAVQAIFDALGPANPDSKRYGPWEANLRHSNLFETVQTQVGVLDSQIILPVAALLEADDPAFPANTTVELLILRSAIIRSYASEGL